MRSSTLAALLLPLLVAATPVPDPSPEPLEAVEAADFPVNVIMVAGAAEFGLWVPHDGLWYPMAGLTCLNVWANAYGACSTTSVDQVGVVAGYGPCSIVGSNGFWETLPGNAGDGLASVAPPQTLTWISCGP